MRDVFPDTPYDLALTGLFGNIVGPPMFSVLEKILLGVFFGLIAVGYITVRLVTSSIDGDWKARVAETICQQCVPTPEICTNVLNQAMNSLDQSVAMLRTQLTRQFSQALRLSGAQNRDHFYNLRARLAAVETLAIAQRASMIRPGLDQHLVLGDRLGHGASGDVFTITTSPNAVVKLLSNTASGSAHQMFFNEVRYYYRTLLRREQPHVPKLLGLVQMANDWRMLLPSYHSDLQDFLVRRMSQPGGSYTELEASLIAFRVTQAVAALHADGYMHRDIKLSNVLVNINRDDGRIQELVLADFGLAALLGTGVTVAGTHIAPEVIAANAEHHYSGEADIFSLGILLSELLPKPQFVRAESRPPRLSPAPVPIPQGLRSDWRGLINRCVADNVAERPSAEDILHTLRTFLTELQFPRCVVCLDRRRDVVLLPCNMFCVCGECAQDLPTQTCPLCREAFTNIIAAPDTRHETYAPPDPPPVTD